MKTCAIERLTVELAREPAVQVTDETARVVVELVGNVVIVRGVNRAKVSLEASCVAEGTRRHTATTSAWREGEAHETKESAIAAGNVLAVAAHGELIAIEELTLINGHGVASPVPVRESASVAAGLGQVGLDGEDVVTVPRKEVGSSMDVVGLVDVGRDILVVAGSHTRVGSAARLGVARAGLLETLHGVRERLALVIGHGPELGTHTRVLVGAGAIGLASLHAGVGKSADHVPCLARGDLVSGEV